MPESCAAYGCRNRRKKGGGVSFHRFPLHNASLLTKWIANVSRQNFHPSKHHVICSEHFLKADYVKGIHPRDGIEISYHELHEEAEPSVFPTHTVHKQITVTKKRPPPRERTITETTTKRAVEVHPAKKPCTDHNYSASPSSVEKKLVVTRQQLQDAREKLRVVRQKVKRQDIRIANLLQQVKDQNLINQGQRDLLKLNFGENILTEAVIKLERESDDVAAD